MIIISLIKLNHTAGVSFRIDRFCARQGSEKIHWNIAEENI